MMAPGNALYIFIDEGGDFTFHADKGSTYFTLTALTMRRSFAAHAALADLKYDQWEAGYEFEYFHATNDKQATRDYVFAIISQHLSSFTIDSIVVEKSKTHPKLQLTGRLYLKIMDVLLSYILARDHAPFSQLIVITDTILLQEKRNEMRKAIKQSLAAWRKMSGKKYQIADYASKSDLNLQIVDYFNWAIFRKWESGDTRSYNLIKSAILSEFDLFRTGSFYYY